MKYLILKFSYLLTITVVLMVSGCDKTTIEEIPSYLAIDTISINTSSAQGTASHKICDSWVYAGNDLIGAFELPARLPLLKSGTTELTIFAGIKLNGINETRAPYPFYEKIKKTVDLEREKVDSLGHLKFSYIVGTKFEWMEDFEQSNLSLNVTPRSEVQMARSQLPELESVFPGELNKYAAKIVIPSDTLVFECASYDSYSLPTDGSSVFLELNYKSNNKFTVGLLVHDTYTSQHSVLVINPSSTWNKIYINLTPALSNFYGIQSFGVFFTAMKSTTDPKAEIYFDNIKLLHF